MKLRKLLLIILGCIIIIGAGVSIALLIQRSANNREQTSIRNINVQPLANDNEKKIRTIIYAGAKMISEVKAENDNQKVNLETTDSIDGAFGIYYQDVLNRYKDYSVSKKTVSKTESLNKNAKIITVAGQSGLITITIWAKANGMSEIEIVTSNNFK